MALLQLGLGSALLLLSWSLIFHGLDLIYLPM
jgi:hypothetical protein